MTEADIVIIGAGAVGCSIAYHLAAMGCRNVLVLDKDRIGEGSTAKCAGGIRQQFSTETNIRLSMESVRFFEHFEEITGHPADFRQHGYLMLATTESCLETFRQNVATQRKMGLRVELLCPRDVNDIVPQLNVGDVLGATYCARDGYADPYSVVQGFAAAARGRGVRFQEDAEVKSIIVTQGRIGGVVTTKGAFPAPVVVNAAGAYAGMVGRMVGLDIPVHPSRRHIFVTAPVAEVRQDAPMVVEFENGFWFRREGPSLIFGMRNPEEREGFDIAVDWAYFPKLAGVAVHRLPLLETTGIVRGQAGLHEDTPDDNGIVGKVPEIGGLYLACGFSGHGFMHSPAVGRLMAELILRGDADREVLSDLSLDRFRFESAKTESCFI